MRVEDRLGHGEMRAAAHLLVKAIHFLHQIGPRRVAGDGNRKGPLLSHLLTRQVKALEEENTRLRENLAVFESLATSNGSTESLSITRLRVEPMGEPGRYRYRMLASWRGSEAKREFKGYLSFHVTMRQDSGRSAVIILPGEKERNADKFAVSFKNFSSLEGSLDLPADAKVERVEARLLQGGLVKASQSIPL